MRARLALVLALALFMPILPHATSAQEAAAAEGGVTDLSSSSTPHANDGIPAITITTTSAAANGDGASMGPTEDTTTASTSGLLRRWEVQPTASRLLQGLRDVAMLVVAVLPFLVLRATRYVIGWLGISEHRHVHACTMHAWTHIPTCVVLAQGMQLHSLDSNPGARKQC